MELREREEAYRKIVEQWRGEQRGLIKGVKMENQTTNKWLRRTKKGNTCPKGEKAKTNKFFLFDKVSLERKLLTTFHLCLLLFPTDIFVFGLPHSLFDYFSTSSKFLCCPLQCNLLWSIQHLPSTLIISFFIVYPCFTSMIPLPSLPLSPWSVNLYILDCFCYTSSLHMFTCVVLSF